VLGYEEFARNPRFDGTFDVVVFNFALLGAELTAVLRAAYTALDSGGAVVIQTVHPYSAAENRYEDGWRTENFAAFGDRFREPMPWYYRTMGTWLHELTRAGLQLIELQEPLHPQSRFPASLILTAQP
jgi:hypothetical protein